MKTVYCIGLNVGDAEPALQLNKTLRCLARIGTVHALVIGAGAWGDCGERMLQVSLTLDTATARAGAAYLALELAQQCVAVLDFSAPQCPRARWRLVDAAGAVSDGGSVRDFPLLAGVLVGNDGTLPAGLSAILSGGQS